MVIPKYDIFPCFGILVEDHDTFGFIGYQDRMKILVGCRFGVEQHPRVFLAIERNGFEFVHFSGSSVPGSGPENRKRA